MASRRVAAAPSSKAGGRVVNPLILAIRLNLVNNSVSRPSSAGSFAGQLGAALRCQVPGSGSSTGLAAVSLVGWQVLGSFPSSDLGDLHGAATRVCRAFFSFGSAWHGIVLSGKSWPTPVYSPTRPLGNSPDFKLTHYQEPGSVDGPGCFLI